MQLQQVILNLAMNGIEAMSGTANRPRILRVRARPDTDTRIVIAIEDSGSGAACPNADRIFEPFFTTKREGIGMGLPICRSIVEAHGGRWWVSPQFPHGSAFHFTLPTATNCDRFRTLNLGTRIPQLSSSTMT